MKIELFENKQYLIEKLEKGKIQYKIIKELLCHALRQGDVAIVQILIGKIDLEEMYQNRWRPIHFAARYGHLEIVQMLLENHVDPRPFAYLDILPIHLAIRFGHIEVVKKLMNYEEMHDKLLVESIKYKQTRIFKYILLKLSKLQFEKDNLVFPPLLKEFLKNSRNDFSILEKLKQNSYGFYCSSKNCYELFNNNMQNPLDYFCCYRSYEITEIFFFLVNNFLRKIKMSNRIRLLRNIFVKDDVRMLKLCIKYNIINPFESLHSEKKIIRNAFTFKSYQIIRYFLHNLEPKVRENFQIGKYIDHIGKFSMEKFINIFIEYNLNLESANDNGIRLIHYVCSYGKVKLFNLLADKVDLNAVDNSGSGVLHHACFDENVELVKELIARKIDINLRDNNEFTPFNVACLNGYIEIVKLLLENGAVMTSPSYITSLNIACRSSNTNIVKLLLNKGLDPNIECNKTLPIHIACYSQNIELIKILLLKTENIDVKDNLNFTPLEIAIQRNNLDMVKLVVDGFISDKIYRINMLSCIHTIPQKYIENMEIQKYIQLKIEIHREKLFSTEFSFFNDIVIITS